MVLKLFVLFVLVAFTCAPQCNLFYGAGGGAPTDATYITQTAHAGLSAEQALSGLASGVLHNTTGTGVLSVSAVTTAEVAAALKTSEFTYTFFDTATDLPDTLDIPSIYPNRARAITLTEVYCEADVANGAVINLQRDDGTPTNILSTNLTCTTAGATTTTFVAGESAIAIGHKIDHVTVSVLASLRRVNLAVKFTID